jgi:hypothetical protein
MVWLSRLGIELHGGHLFAGVVQNGARCCKECINGQGLGFGCCHMRWICEGASWVCRAWAGGLAVSQLGSNKCARKVGRWVNIYIYIRVAAGCAYIYIYRQR